MTFNLVRQRSAVGVAQHDPARAGIECGPRNGESIIAVAFVAIEEVLAVDHSLALRFDDGLRTDWSIVSRFSSFEIPSATRT